MTRSIVATLGLLVVSGCGGDEPSQSGTPDKATGGSGNLDGGTAGAETGGTSDAGTGGAGAASVEAGAPPLTDTRGCFARCTADSDCSGCPVAATCTNSLCGLVCTPRTVVSDLILGADNPQTVAEVLGATEIQGRLTIVGDDRRNLRVLACLERVDGDVSIGIAPPFCPPPGFGFPCPPPPLLELTSLLGLERLAAITGILNINNNSVLSSLDALSGLTTVQGLGISNNPRVKSVPLGSLATIGGSVYIGGNAALETLVLDHVSVVTGDFVLEDEPLLKDFTGVGALGEIGGSLSMTANEGFQSFAGLDALRRIGGSFHIENMPALASLAPLSGVTSVGDNASLSNVPALTSVDGFPRTASLPGGLTIANAASLADLRGFASLTETGSLALTSIPKLPSLAGFDALTKSPHIEISDAPLLTSLATLSGVRGTSDVIITNVGAADLTGLGGITGGSFYIGDNAALRSLTGLGGVTSATSVWVQHNPKLASIAALSKLTSVTGDLSFVGNDTLPSLVGLEGITIVTGSIDVEGNPLVTTLSPLSGVRGTVMGLSISGGGQTDLHGLEGIQQVLDTLGIGYSAAQLGSQGTSKLTSLRGLDSVSSVGSVLIMNNAALVDLSLAQLKTVNVGLSIHGNPSLVRLAGLSAVTSVGGQIAIYDNQSLPHCEAISFANRLGMTCGPDEVTCQDICTCPGNNGTATCP